MYAIYQGASEYSDEKYIQGLIATNGDLAYKVDQWRYKALEFEGENKELKKKLMHVEEEVQSLRLIVSEFYNSASPVNSRTGLRIEIPSRRGSPVPDESPICLTPPRRQPPPLPPRPQQPPPLPPRPQQLQQEEKKRSPDVLDCAICQSEVVGPIVTECNHIFCYDCITEASKQGVSRCPLCRKPGAIPNRYRIIDKIV